MTERLYYHDSYLGEFQARIVDVGLDRRTIYLDRTAFYPTSGGQPSDRGTVAGIPVADVVDEDTRIAHILSKPAPAGLEGAFVECVIDARRRADHREQHTGQHLLSAVFVEMMGAETVSFHLGGETSTVDIAHAALTVEEIERVEERANAVVRENRPVTVSFGEASDELRLRKATERAGTIRVVTIENLDRSACGGTHVRQTGEIGAILIRKLDKVRGNTRVEFVCGGRAVVLARRDYDALSSVARLFSAPLEQALPQAAAQRVRLEESEKTRKALSAELAVARGLRAYGETAPGTDGLRRLCVRVGSITEDTRTEAMSFTSGPGAVFLGLSENPPSVLFAASEGCGVHAGDRVKRALAELGGRGGGNARVAQGSLPEAGLLARAEELLGE